MKKARFPAPNHIAFIMDGNGRWGVKHHSNRLTGHQKGKDTMDITIDHCVRMSIPHASVFAFSAENWRRSKMEVYTLMNLFLRTIEEIHDKCLRNGVRVQFIGNREDGKLSSELLVAMAQLENDTQTGSVMTLCIAINYSGKDEQDRAVKKAFAAQSTNWKQFLDTGDAPDVDIMIRTGCDEAIPVWRDSDFMTVQSANAHKIPLRVLWPDFSAADLEMVIYTWQQAEHLNGGQRSSVV